ncbi:MAG: GH39 family glycosyl hydrolase [Planctomycetota bacterium]
MLLHIAADRTVAPLAPIWASTGFTPARHLLADDMRLNLAYLGSVPHQGIRHCRVHWLLDLVRVAGVFGNTPAYDWSRLDAALAVIIDHGLVPFFELMGNPSQAFTDFGDPMQLRAWRRLCCDLALHLIERYGRDAVLTWHFECWNEPDLPVMRQPGSILHRLEHNLAYYDASAAGIKDADAELRVGGPGTALGPNQYYEDFLDHCDHGENAFGGTGAPLDFVSFHVKSQWAGDEQVDPDHQALLRRTRGHIESVRRRPNLAQLPLYDDECDPSGPWCRHMLWRPRSYYAAIVVRFLELHLRHIVDGMGADLRLVSNDNGFLGPWGYRTLLTRFGSDAELADGRCELLKKPVFNAMVLLSLLGDERLAVTGGDDECNVIATRRGDDQVALLVYHQRDAIMSSGAQEVELAIDGLPFQEATLARYRIAPQDERDVFALWEQHRVDEGISEVGLQAIRAVQDIGVACEPETVRCANGSWRTTFDMPLHSLELLLLTRDPGTAPAAVGQPRLAHYHGLHQHQHVLVSWPGLPSRHLRSYEVAMAHSPDGPWQRLNAGDLLCTAHLHVRPATPQAWYRVRAVDYWGRAGAWSPVVAG